MNKIKKIMSVFLIAVLICMNNVNSSAAVVDETNSQEEESIIERIANGSDEVIGDGVYFDGESKARFTSGGINHTHQYIVAKAITILKNDKNISFYDDSIGSVVMEYADKPDDDDIGLAFASHFWDPDTNKNYLGQTSGTAKTRFIEYYESAVQIYNTNRPLSYQYLGRAIHYLTDIGEPHHASNKIAGLTNHSEFEKWVDVNRTKYSATSSDKYSVCTSNDLTTILKKLGTYSKSYSSTVESEDNWNTVANDTVTTAQKYVAGILYRYLKDVGEY